MVQKLKKFLPILALSLIPTLILWLPFFLRVERFWGIPLPREGMATISSNYDGPLYIVVAKTWYSRQQISEQFSFPIPVEYYAAHFPLFPLLVRVVALSKIVYPYAMLIVTALSSVLALSFFNKFIKQYVNQNDALFLTAAFAIFPARWLIVRSVGSPEPLFLASTIASVYFFQKEKYVKAGIWGALAQLTKSAGILLFVSYLGVIIYRLFRRLGNIKKDTSFNKLPELKSLPVFLIPISLIAVFYLFKITMNDFFAYFHSGDNIHLFFPPFQVFNYSASWVGTFWLEEIVFIYLVGVIGVLTLIRQKKEVLAFYAGVFFLSTIFVSHRDLLRYSLPLVPFFYAAFGQQLVKREFKIALLFIILPIFLFSLAYISQNTMPISDWGPLL